MSDGERKQITLYVPTNITTHFEFVSGVGMHEMAVTAMVTGLAIVIAVIINTFTQDVYKAVLFVLVSGTATFMAVRKNDINQSIVDIIRLVIRFSSTQQKYKYEYNHKFIGNENK